MPLPLLLLLLTAALTPPLYSLITFPAAIPFIVHPIDGGVHAILNATLRPAMRRYICSDAGGAQAGLAICEDCKQRP